MVILIIPINPTKYKRFFQVKSTERNVRCFISLMSKPVSRVLSLKTTIYLGLPLPTGSSHLLGTAGPACVSPCHGVAPDRVYSVHVSPRDGWALTPPFHHHRAWSAAVYFCCTCPRVTPGGRYPLSLPCGARTFLMHRLSPCARGRSACSRGILIILISQVNPFLYYCEKRSIIYI